MQLLSHETTAADILSYDPRREDSAEPSSRRGVCSCGVCVQIKPQKLLLISNYLDLDPMNTYFSCPPKAFLNSTSQQCQTCPAGRFKTRWNYDSECDLCELGTYLSNNTCQPCPAGTYGFHYRDEINRTSSRCRRCDGNDAPAISPHTNNPHAYPNNGFGAYQDGTGKLDCKFCAVGRYLDGASDALMACYDCPAGEYGVPAKATGIGKESYCLACPEGQFQNLAAQPEIAAGPCNRCVNGREMQGSKNSGSCVDCSAGRSGTCLFDDCIGNSYSTSVRVVDSGQPDLSMSPEECEEFS